MRVSGETGQYSEPPLEGAGDRFSLHQAKLDVIHKMLADTACKTRSDSAGQKQAVPRQFDTIARRYDLLCRLNPGYRRHLRWSAQRMALPPRARIRLRRADFTAVRTLSMDGWQRGIVHTFLARRPG